MNSTQIKCFLSLGKTLNYSKTADELFMSQPAVTKNIQKLEHELNIRLVKRQYNKISLTSAGVYFWNKMIIANNFIDDTINNMQRMELANDTSINLGFTSIPFEENFLPHFIKLIKKHYNYDIKLIFLDPSNNESIAENLANKKVDFMLFQNDLFFKNKAFAYTPLFHNGFSVMVSKQNPLSNHETLKLDELAGNKVLLWNGTSDAIPLITELKYRLNDRHAYLDVIDIDEIYTLSIYVRANEAIAIIPSSLYNPSDQYADYVKLDFPTNNYYSVGYLKDTIEKPYFKRFIKTLKYAINFEKKNW